MTILLQVVELLTHVSKRLRNRPAVQLPVDKLLTQFTDTTSSTALVVLHHYDIIALLNIVFL